MWSNTLKNQCSKPIKKAKNKEQHLWSLQICKINNFMGSNRKSPIFDHNIEKINALKTHILEASILFSSTTLSC